MIYDEASEIKQNLNKLLDINKYNYHKMYGALVRHINTGKNGKIIRRPDDPKYDGVYDIAVFILMEDEGIVHLSPGTFLEFYNIIENNSLSSINITFGRSTNACSLLDRYRAAEILRKNK